MVSLTSTQPGYVRKVADWGAVVDSTGGTASYTITAAEATYTASDIANARASFALIANDIRTALINAGVI